MENYILSNWAGIRPLVLDDEAQNNPAIMSKSGNVKGKIRTADLARTHMIEKFPSGLVSVMGGKWTIYRQMGEDGVKAVLDHFEENDIKTQEEIKKARSKSTLHLRLMGDYRKKYLKNEKLKKTDFSLYHKILVDQLSKNQTLGDLNTLNYLARKYGVRAYDIINIMKKNPELKKKIHKDYELTKAEILYFVKYEHSVSPIDILLNRSRIAFYDSESAYSIIPHIVEIMGNFHGWDEEKKKLEYKANLEIFEQMRFFNVAKPQEEE